MSGTPSAAWWQFLRTLTALQRSSPQKKSWQTRKKSLKPSRCCMLKSAQNLLSKLYPLLHIFLAVRILWDKEEIRCCQGETWERCERNHRTDSGLLLVHVNCSIFMLLLLQEREGAYTDYQDASALKYSHVPSASRFAFLHESRMVRRKISLVCFINFL